MCAFKDECFHSTLVCHSDSLCSVSSHFFSWELITVAVWSETPPSSLQKTQHATVYYCHTSMSVISTPKCLQQDFQASSVLFPSARDTLIHPYADMQPNVFHFSSLYPMIFEYWARICRRYQSVGPILADTDILNPRILMHEARKADNPHGCTVFSGFFEPFLYPKTGVSYIWPGGVRISLPNAPIWPQWTALENVMKCDERHMFGLSFTAFIYCIMSIRTFSLILHVLFLTI